MILENPALVLNITVQDIMSILEETLRERNWDHFELMNLKLTYVPYYFFNYDTLVEQDVQGQTFSQGFSGLMAINAVSGKLEPMLVEIMEKQPVDKEREISHGLQYEIIKPAITEKELPDTCKIKLAGQFSVGRNSLAVSGFRLFYWPIWKVFVTLPKNVQKLEIDGVSGITLNVQEVPEREKGWMEVTTDTFEKMKSVKGWGELSKSVAKVAKGAAKTAATKEKAEGSKSQGMIYWILHTKMGHYSLILLLLLILVIYYLARG